MTSYGFKRILASVTAILMACLLIMPVFASTVPYLSYTYDFWGREVPTPAAYVAVKSIGGRDIDPDLGPFRAPEDLAVDADGNIYLLDTGNNRIVVFDRNLTLIRVIDSFMRDGRQEGFNNPNGIFVTDNFEIYIADTNNGRVIALHPDGSFMLEISEPQGEGIEENFVFMPLKVVVDRAGRIYVIARNVFEGIMSFDSNGHFFGYFGTIPVVYTPLDWIWRQLSTPAQRAQQRLFIPMEFSGMDIDERGFVYTVNLPTVSGHSGNAVRRLNPSGNDVLANFTNLPIAGDLVAPGVFNLPPSAFIDIIERGHGIYSALDSTRGRLFTYDSEGNLLYVVGGLGNVLGMVRQPTAVEVSGESILILDRLRGEIVYFEETLYGSLINEAVRLRYMGDEAAAVERWRSVLVLNENYGLALRGIGRALLAAGENRAAMDYLRRSMDVDYFGIAFRRYRNEILEDNFRLILTSVLVIALALNGRKIYRKFRSAPQV